MVLWSAGAWLMCKVVHHPVQTTNQGCSCSAGRLIEEKTAFCPRSEGVGVVCRRWGALRWSQHYCRSCWTPSQA
eukprot:6208985-Pleurochrysis_carterae.AAC.1